MANIVHKISLRKRRREGKRYPTRINLSKIGIGEKDTLFLEITVNKQEGIKYIYQFSTDQLIGKKYLSFTISENNVYWLKGETPKQVKDFILPRKRKISNRLEQKSYQELLITDKKKKVMIFDENQKFLTICANVSVVATFTHFFPKYIDKLCRSKKRSKDTGFYFRYVDEKINPSININDFNLTVSQYDELCKKDEE